MKPNIILAVSALVLLTGHEANAQSSCAALKTIAGDSCEQLAVNLDLSKCGGSTYEKSKVDFCNGSKFQVSAALGSKTYVMSGETKMWNGKVIWDTPTFKFSEKGSSPKTAEKKPVENKAARKTANVEPKGTPPQLTQSPQPQTSAQPAVAQQKAQTIEAAATPAATPAPQAAIASPVTPASTPVASPTAAPASQAATAFVQTLNFNGDIRLRGEEFYNENPSAGKNAHYNHMRLRARAGAKAQPTESVSLEIRLATSTGGPSTNQTLGDGTKGFRNYDFKLDRASFAYKPHEKLVLSGGRIAKPFTTAGDNDLLFDADVNFDGAALGTNYTLGDFTAYANAGHFILEESKDASSVKDVTLHVGQVGMNWSGVKDLKVGVIASAFGYNDVQNHAAIVTGEFSGNSNNGTVYTNGYALTTFGLEASYKWKFPISIFGETGKNFGASENEKSFIYGFKVGTLKAESDWSVAIDWRELQKDSSLGILSDGDCAGGGANVRCTRASASYMVNKAFFIQVTQFFGTRNLAVGESASKRDKFQLDLNFKF